MPKASTTLMHWMPLRGCSTLPDRNMSTENTFRNTFPVRIHQWKQVSTKMHYEIFELVILSNPQNI